MSNVKAFDASEWQERPGSSWFKALAADGHKLGVIQLWGSGPSHGGGQGPNSHAQYQLGQTGAAGMAIAGYIVIPRDTTVKTDQLIAAGLKAAGPYARDLKFVAADIESDLPIHPASPGQRLSNALADIRRAGLKPIIYTSRSKWPKSMGAMVTGFNRVPLWDASYLTASGTFPGWPGDEHFDGGFIKYGGWEKRAMWQLAGTVQAVPNPGNVADLNLADFARLGISEEVKNVPDPRVDDVLEELRVLQGAVAGLTQRVEALETRGTTPSPVPQPPGGPRYDKLTAEDGHVTGFAQRHGLTLNALIALNPNGPRFRPHGRTWDSNWNVVFPGDEFRVA